MLRATVTDDRPAARVYATESAQAGDVTDPDVLREDATTAAYVIASALGIDLG